MTPDGRAYRANDEELLNWVQATASYGFLEAYRRFVRPLTDAEVDAYYAEAAPGATLFGARHVPHNNAEMEALFAAMRPKLERSVIIFDFLDIVRRAPLLPSRAAQRLLIRAALDIIPFWARDILGVHKRARLGPGGASLVHALGAAMDRIVLESAPPAQSCLRLGLPMDFCYR
jgi:uncharacterized protein (DUF2236 family)